VTEQRPHDLLPVLAVVLGAGGAALTGWLVSFRAAGLVLAAVLAGVAVARLALPVTSVGALAVRSRGLDAATAGALAVAIAVLAVTAPS
jgi:hypothetical protein